MPRHVVLREKPAQLRVTGTGGARIAVDGQVRGTAPTAGAAGAIAAGVLGGLTLARQSEAIVLRDRKDAGSLTPSERDRYDAAVDARGHLSAAAAVAGGVSFLAAAVG